MYAIIRTGGKQAKVRPGDVIEVERLKNAGDQVTFTPLLVVDENGSTISDKSSLKDVTVTAKVLGESQGPKIDIFKYKNKTGYRRRMGHRQVFTQIEVTSIDLPKAGKAKAAKATAKKSAAAADSKQAEAAASEEE